MPFSENYTFTIITSTYNCADSLSETALSIRSQTYKNFQWIVIDGLSTDGTFNVIYNNKDIINDWVSEKDKGIYDAWNKAIKFIKGDWILFLGAGDIFHDNNSLQNLSSNLLKNIVDYDLLYCNVYITNKNGVIRYLSRKCNLNYYEHGRIALPNHQGVLHSKKCFENGNTFDSELKIAGDSKFLMKILKNGKIKHIDITLTHMKDDGVSNNIKNILVARSEINTMCNDLDYKIPLTHKFIVFAFDYFLIFYNVLFPKYFIKIIRNKYDSLRS